MDSITSLLEGEFALKYSILLLSIFSQLLSIDHPWRFDFVFKKVIVNRRLLRETELLITPFICLPSPSGLNAGVSV